MITGIICVKSNSIINRLFPLNLNLDNAYPFNMENTTINELRNTIIGYNSVFVNSSNVNVEKVEVEYALLPVWMLNIKYKDKMYTFAMNGQTKQVVGKVPLCFSKMLKKGLLFFGIGFLVAFIFNIIRGMM